jgi:citrate lyase subunit beta/citryl-CoA lyase
MLDRVRTARTLLFVPGHQPDRFARAKRALPDLVIIDLEDGVPSHAKDRARDEAAAAIRRDPSFAVRVSAYGSAHGIRDLDVLMEQGARPSAVIVSRSEDPLALAAIGSALAAPLIPLVETARGLEQVGSLAAEAGVVRIALGAVDLMLDVSASADEDVLAPVRSRLVMASRAAGIGAPIDTPCLDIEDLDSVRASALAARRFGMGGKLCIHPAQIPVIAQAFLPSRREVEGARALLRAAPHDGAARVNGSMVDRPVLEQARRVLEQAGMTEGAVPGRSMSRSGDDR